MLQPKRTKFRKQQKGRNRGLAHRGSTVSFGEFALKATGRGRMTLGRSKRLDGNDSPNQEGRSDLDTSISDKPITQKPLEVRQVKERATLILDRTD